MNTVMRLFRALVALRLNLIEVAGTCQVVSEIYREQYVAALVIFVVTVLASSISQIVLKRCAPMTAVKGSES